VLSKEKMKEKFVYNLIDIVNFKEIIE